jgi:putative aldouronate transport system permease protein
VRPRIHVADYAIYLVILLWVCLTLYPFLNVLAISFSTYGGFIANPLRIIPGGLSADAYRVILGEDQLYTSFRNTVIITAATVAILLPLCAITAYPLSRKTLRGRGVFMVYLIITMMFSGGLIPNYFLIRTLGLYDTLAALVVFLLLPGFYVILMKSFFESIPDSLVDAATIDGASHLTIVFRVMVPMSKSIMATIGLFSAVGQWNSFFYAVVFTRGRDKSTLMLYLREIIAMTNKRGDISLDLVELLNIPVEMVKYAALVVVVVPIALVYPFVQRYFVKGIMIGAVKE